MDLEVTGCDLVLLGQLDLDEAPPDLAHQDALIAIPNRRGFMRELERLVARVQRYKGSAAMLFVDLDGLKMINDSFGHRAGDEALIEVAALLAKGIRRSDVVARIGGDEFGILLEHASESSAQETATRLTDLICSREFRHDGDVLPPVVRARPLPYASPRVMGPRSCDFCSERKRE